MPRIPSLMDSTNRLPSFPLSAAQYINLYHGVWWLPMSNQNQAINYHLIDRHTAVFITAILCRRLPCALYPTLEPRHSAWAFFFPTISYCAVQVNNHNGRRYTSRY